MGHTACTEPQCLYSWAIPLLPLWAVRPVQSLSACTVQLYLYSPCGPYGLYRASVPVQYSYTSTPPMDRKACTEPQCLYSTAIPLLPLWTVRPVQSHSACTKVHLTPYLTLPDGPWSWTDCAAVELRIGAEQGFQEHVTPVPFATVRRRVWGCRLDDLQGKSWSFLYMTKIYWIWWTSNTSLLWPPRFLRSPGQTTISTIRWSHIALCHGNPVSVLYTILHEITNRLFHRNGRTIG